MTEEQRSRLGLMLGAASLATLTLAALGGQPQLVVGSILGIAVSILLITNRLPMREHSAPSRPRVIAFFGIFFAAAVVLAALDPEPWLGGLVFVLIALLAALLLLRVSPRER